jgi:hypothetical protein
MTTAPLAPAQILSPRQWLTAIIVIAVMAYVVYAPSLSGGFLWDDDTLITHNPLITAPDGLIRIWFTSEAVDYWPVTNSSFWIEWRLWGMNPIGYHVTNLVLHVGNAILFWAILRHLRIPGALLAAAIFTVHPINIESVAWIAQRKNTLSQCFFLLSVLWFLKDESGSAGRRRGWYALSLAGFVLAMLSKGSAASLPLVLLLIVWWTRNRITARDVLRAVPFFVVAAALTLVNLWFRTHGDAEVFRQATLAERIAGAGAIVWFYVFKAVWPIHLAFVYPLWRIDSDDIRWWLPLAAALVLTALLLWYRGKPWGRAGLFAWLYYGVALLPVLGFADTPFMRYSLVADHYQYTAILGLAALVAAGLSAPLETVGATLRDLPGQTARSRAPSNPSRRRPQQQAR